MCDSVFELDEHLNMLSFYVGTEKETQAMQKLKATLKIAVSTEVDAYSLGKKELWPQEVEIKFLIPEIP